MIESVVNILKSAHIQLGILASGEAMSASMKDEALPILNRMLDAWQNENGIARTAQQTIATTVGIPHVTLNPVSSSVIAATLLERLYEISDIEYMEMPDKTTRGTPRYFYHDNDKLYLYPAPDSVQSLVVLYNQSFGEYAIDDDIDLPGGYIPAIIPNLAIELSPIYPGVPIPEFVIVNAKRLKGQLRRTFRRTPRGMQFQTRKSRYNINTDL